jgi:hypothetical protein
VKQKRQLARVVAEFLEPEAKEMPSEEADLFLRSGHLLREPNHTPTAIAGKMEPLEMKQETNVGRIARRCKKRV